MQYNATLPSFFRTRVTAFLVLLLLAGLSADAQLVAFPGAEGAGRFATGGRGTAATPTTVYAVTTLADDVSNPAVGSLRHALAQNVSSRTIVFRVSGTIRLAGPLSVKQNTTIAGQTAPGAGICIADHPVIISGNNVIIRYMRFRLGDKNQAAVNGNDDALGTNGNGYKNLLIDHCSVSWSNDEALSVYSGDSTTLQWNIVSEPLNLSYHNEGSGVESHGYGGIMGGRKVSIHHNLFAHCYSRTPRFDGTRNLGNSAAGLENVEFVNNVLYNWGINNVYGGEGGNYNIIGNYYKYGPSTNSGVRFRVANPYKQTSSPAIPYGKYYLAGNYVDGSATNTANNWRGVTMDGGSAADTALAKATTPFSISTLAAQDAAAAYSLVLQQAGATLPIRDSLDQRIVNDVMNRTGRIIDVQGGYPRLTPFATSQSAWPTLVGGTAPVDTDNDGMPDSYETANSLNPNDAADREGIAANGYTNLENYLNGITTTPQFSVSGNLSGFSQTISTPAAASASRAYSLSGSNLTTDVTVTAPANFEVSANGTTWAGTATIPVSGGNLSSSSVYVRMNAASAGSYSGVITNTTSSITQTIPVSGIATTAPAGVNATVAKDGTGNYTTVQAAIDAVATGRTTPWVIYIKDGKYREKIVIPSTKPFIQLVGESVANTIIYYDDPATTLGTSGSASVTINAPDFAAMNITFANTYGDGSQAVAVLVNNDRAVFKNCRFLGNQDTFYGKGSGTPRVYLSQCYIDGNIDFIFGSAIAVFDNCVIYPKARTAAGNSFITAANTPTGQNYGLVFRNSIIANNTGATTYYLGRPWQNTTTASPVILNNRTTFLNTTMGYTISPDGWTTWDATTNTAGIDYGEFGSKDFQGAPVNTSGRVAWATALTAAQAANYTNANLFGSWDPCAVAANICTLQQSPIAVSNFRGTKGSLNASVDWNISWNMMGITYDLYRSTSRNSGYSLLSSVTSVNDTAYNFNYTEALPTSGTVYYYYLVASRAGMASHTTDTISISNLQTIVTAGTLNAFTQNIGTPSPSQTFTASGTNLTDDVTVTPPANYEVSTDGANWFTSSNPLVLTQAAGSVAATPISVRLNSPSIGTWGGNIVLSSAGATSVNMPVTGSTAIIAPVTERILQWWPMTANNIDSVGARAPGVAPSTTRFNRMTVSNGTTVATVPPYSPQRGQALAPLTATLGEGLWSSSAGGPGGSLNRTIYEQFVIKGANPAVDSLQIDSLILSAAFYNSTSSTRLGVVWSKTGFSTADSTDVSTTPGGFTNFIVLNQQNTGPTDVYRLAFNGSTGVSIKRGDSLTFRIYFSCSSSSTGRYALLKDVMVKGARIDATIPPPTITVNPATLPAFSQNLGIPSASQSYTVSSTDLVSPILVVPPANYEVSLNGTTWNNSTTPIILNPVGGVVASTTIQVRLNASATGTYSGVIKNMVASGTNKDVTVTGTTAAIPTIVAVPATLATFSQTLGSPSATQTYTLSAFNLVGNLTVTPPANYEVSGDGGTTWFNSSSPLLITPVGTSVAPIVITVRLFAPASGTYGGNIVHSSGTAALNLPVNGITSGTPTLIQAGTLAPFTQTVGTPSAVQTYTLSGSALSANVTVAPPAGYEVSADGTNWFTSSSPLVLTPAAGTLATTTISIRLNAGAAGTFGGDVVHASTGATSVLVPVTGTVVPAPVLNATASFTPFTQTIGVAQPEQTYTVSGSNLVGANVTITPPVGYEISLNGTTWVTNTTPIQIPVPASGTLAATTIHVRMAATTTGTYGGNILHTGTGFAAVNVPVTGTAILPPTITVSSATLSQFSQTIGAPSGVQSYTVSGQNLTADLTITAPAGYQLSLDGITWSSAPLTLAPAAGVVAATTVSVRLNATAAGNYNGPIVNASTGAASRNVNITGVAVVPPSFLVSVPQLQPFRQILGSPSNPQSYVLNGAGLLGPINITPAAGYQVSLDSGKTWSFVPVTVTPNAGTVNQAVWVRLNAGTTGTHGYTIIHQSNGVANRAYVDVIGITTTEATGDYSVYPVPAFNKVWFSHPVTTKAATITIFSIGGERLRTLRAVPGAVETPIDINTMAQGVYLAVYDNGEERVTRRFVKE
ncbi:T9SS type A sorting domain-containing protein [Flaviaesturariibacter flavus]|uniref:T9SS type A sorting domain-containing protein n=1 Tax=Flaviaesturariibacter flavus TaxID=2502780 RepID=A0A4R1BB79_9BACT|nr:pectinesterase family protein [Flaviaesturariibacter flavus]TCJ14223.1 T9SS type A sorting domain-containing protein [Flaviaesturariibacter flavus]